MVLGNPRGAKAFGEALGRNDAAVEALKGAADRRAEALRPIVLQLITHGRTSLSALAAGLNEMGMLTARGGAWHRSSVRNLVGRLGIAI